MKRKNFCNQNVTVSLVYVLYNKGTSYYAAANLEKLPSTRTKTKLQKN
ncbi:hypothetical protein [Bacillus pakistanensis]|nr:hypothetical protein [Bacillus pakistanensis]